MGPGFGGGLSINDQKIFFFSLCMEKVSKANMTCAQWRCERWFTISPRATSWITSIASEGWGTTNAGTWGFRSREDINPMQKISKLLIWISKTEMLQYITNNQRKPYPFYFEFLAYKINTLNIPALWEAICASVFPAWTTLEFSIQISNHTILVLK